MCGGVAPDQHDLVQCALCRTTSQGSSRTGGNMGDKSPKAKNKNKQQNDDSKQKKAAEARAKQAPKTALK
jgi:hypothetical protein